MQQLQANTVAYLSPSFAPYRTPVFDALHQRIGNGFTVVCLERQRHTLNKLALKLGSFPRTLVRGAAWFNINGPDEGRKTPLGFHLTPSLPFVLARLHPTVVISNNFNLWTLTAQLMGYRTVIFWEGTTHTERTVQAWRGCLRRWMIRRASAFVVNGRLSRAYLEELGAPPQAIFEGGMCAFPLPERHEEAGPRIFLRGPVRFLFVGQLVDRKGIQTLLRAAALLQATNNCTDRFEVVIVGEGPKGAELLQMTSELHLEAIVKFVNFVTPGEVWDRYAECHVFVLPTLQDNWPLVVPEAMAMGMPIVISDRAGSAPDLLREGHNGWTFNPERPASLAEILARYIERPDLIESQGRHSIELVRKYTPEHAADALLGAVSFAHDY